MPDMPTLTVLAFARYAELLGAAELQLRVPAGATVGTLIQQLRALPGGGALPERLLVAVNARQAGLDHPVTIGDEVALLPPMAGG